MQALHPAAAQRTSALRQRRAKGGLFRVRNQSSTVRIARRAAAAAKIPGQRPRALVQTGIPPARNRAGGRIHSPDHTADLCIRPADAARAVQLRLPAAGHLCRLCRTRARGAGLGRHRPDRGHAVRRGDVLPGLHPVGSPGGTPVRRFLSWAVCQLAAGGADLPVHRPQRPSAAEYVLALSAVSQGRHRPAGLTTAQDTHLLSAAYQPVPDGLPAAIPLAGPPGQLNHSLHTAQSHQP